MATEKKHITKAMRRIWGIGIFGEGVNMTPAQMYGTYFLTDIALVPSALLATTTMITSVLMFVLTPLGGWLIDGTKPMRWGKLRSWLLVGSVISFIFSPVPFIYWGSPAATAITICVLGLISSTFYTTQVTATFSLVPSMCAYDDEASHLASNQMTGNKIGTMFAGFIVPLVMTPLLLSTGNMAYIIIAMACNAVMFITYMVHFKLADGFEGNGKVGKVAEERLSFKDMAIACAAVPEIIPLIIADITSTLGAFLLPGLVVYMYRYVIMDGTQMGMMAVHNLAIGFAGMIGSYTARWWMKKIPDRRKVIYILYPFIAIFMFSCRFFTQNVFMFIFTVSLTMLFQGTTQPVENTLYYDIGVIAQDRMGKDPTATFISLAQLAPRVAGIIRGVVISVLFVSLNYDATQPMTEAIKGGFVNAFSLVNCVIPIVGWLGMLIFYKVTPQRVEAARASLAAKAGETV
ncbi:MAG: MFS transporter [Peptococcaceae bacterium]|nr:MFS transporter [Peptococcaceae bacterium]